MKLKRNTYWDTYIDHVNVSMYLGCCGCWFLPHCGYDDAMAYRKWSCGELIVQMQVFPVRMHRRSD